MKKNENGTYKRGLIGLLEIKDSDIRIMTLQQCREAVDKGIHSGGAFSAVIPLVALYYGGCMNYDLEQPTRIGQDMFILSKGHAVASLASIYADLGLYPPEVLLNSRSYNSILNGHPGPVLPGIHISTGPLGQGIAVAQGYALCGKKEPFFDVYCMTGDGELQEGILWEAIMYAAHKKLDNFCVMVDHNHGQLDVYDRLIFPMENLRQKFESFGWKVLEVDARKYKPVLKALRTFREKERDGKPTVIICNTTKGFGAFNPFLNKHKVVISDDIMQEELQLQYQLRKKRVKRLLSFIDRESKKQGTQSSVDRLLEYARKINLELNPENHPEIVTLKRKLYCRRAPVRQKEIKYERKNLPRLDKKKQYSAAGINTQVMQEFAKDSKVVSVDADLSSTSGLEAGIKEVDPHRAINVGVAEANMMNLGEAFASLGYQAFVSTFCPFFDWKVMRRIAVGQQERLESIDSPSGWLNKGHGLDLTFVATAPNFETKTNGATHMGNDDIIFFDAMAQLRIIDISCPQQQIAVLRWIAEGNKGLVYMRIMRAPAPVLYPPEFKFTFGRAYALIQPEDPEGWILSSGRGTHEAIAASQILTEQNISIGVFDMPSIDESLLLDLSRCDKPVIIVEQNNGFIWSNLSRILLSKKIAKRNTCFFALNTLDQQGRPRFVHSGTYQELTQNHHLDAGSIAKTMMNILTKTTAT